jgi:hypothetical protein
VSDPAYGLMHKQTLHDLVKENARLLGILEEADKAEYRWRVELDRYKALAGTPRVRDEYFMGRIAALEAALAEAEKALHSIHGFQCGCEWPGDPKECIALPSEDFAVLSPKKPTSIGAVMRGE